MKTTLIIIILFAISTALNIKIGHDYIEILHTSNSQKPFKQSFITKKPITLEIIDNQFKNMGYSVKRLSSERRIELWNILFTSIATNGKTFEAIATFVRQNPMFFIKRYSKSRTNYSVIINGYSYKSDYKSQNSFFTSMIKYSACGRCCHRTTHRHAKCVPYG